MHVNYKVHDDFLSPNFEQDSKPAHVDPWKIGSSSSREIKGQKSVWLHADTAAANNSHPQLVVPPLAPLAASPLCIPPAKDGSGLPTLDLFATACIPLEVCRKPDLIVASAPSSPEPKLEIAQADAWVPSTPEPSSPSTPEREACTATLGAPTSECLEAVAASLRDVVWADLPVPPLARAATSPLTCQWPEQANSLYPFSDDAPVYMVTKLDPDACALERFKELKIRVATPLCLLSFGRVMVQEVHSPFNTAWLDPNSLSTDPCGEGVFDILKASGDVDGLCLFLELVASRLGGNVADAQRLRTFATGWCAHPQSYQKLLQLLHDQAARNAAGMRTPGDQYGLQQHCIAKLSESVDV